MGCSSSLPSSSSNQEPSEIPPEGTPNDAISSSNPSPDEPDTEVEQATNQKTRKTIKQSQQKTQQQSKSTNKSNTNNNTNNFSDINSNSDSKSNSRYMQINQSNSRQSKPSSTVISSSKYIGHLSKPQSKMNQEDSTLPDGKTPPDSEFISPPRSTSPQKRNPNTSNSTSKPLPTMNSTPKHGRSASAGRPPFSVSSNNSVSSASTTQQRDRKSTGGIPETRKNNTRTNQTQQNNSNNRRQQKQQPRQQSYLEKCREEGRPSSELELIETIEREVVHGKLNVTWDSIGGLKQAKDLLQEAVVLPQLIPDYFQGIRRPWRGILMFGPPGTGKTMLAKAVASECACTFLNVSAATLGSKWRGESEKMVRILFEIAGYYSPSTIFIDEIDSIAGARGASNEHESSRRVKTELMVQMDGMNSEISRNNVPSSSSSNSNNNGIQAPRKNSFNGTTRKSNNSSNNNSNNNTRGARSNTTVSSISSSTSSTPNRRISSPERNDDGDIDDETPPSPPVIIVIAATNTPWDLDEALRRRFEKRIYIPLPDLEGRVELFRMNMKSLEVDSDVNYEELAKKSNGYSGSDITNVCRDASMMGMRRFIEEARNQQLTNTDIQNILTNNSGGNLTLQSVVTRNDFLTSLSKINKSVNEKQLKRFEEWMSQFGSS